MNPDYIFGTIKFNDVLLWIIGVAGVVTMLDSNGFLPPRITKWLSRNKNDATLQALKELGVRATWDENLTTKSSVFDRIFERLGVKQPAYKSKLAGLLSEDTFTGGFEVGKGTFFKHDEFIDVMGASVSPDRATVYAQLLNSFIDDSKIGSFDAVAGLKSGSPILAYEFAKLRKKPLILGTEEKVKPRGDMKLHDQLDYSPRLDLKTIGRVLLVDDSTTGGRKMVELAEVLRKAGIEVNHAVVLFEPIGKGARARLLSHKIELHSIQEGPKGTT